MQTSLDRIDYKVIAEVVEEKSKVLDLGCGNGVLLEYLVKERQVNGHGIELLSSCIKQCVEKGLTVFHADIQSGLKDYPDSKFDYVIMNQSMQEMKNVDFIMDEALRVGKKLIVGFPNFAHINSRIKLAFGGKAPMTQTLPYSWYDTPNLHFLSIIDFKEFCQKKNFIVEKSFYLGKNKTVCFLPNLRALDAVFVLSKKSN